MDLTIIGVLIIVICGIALLIFIMYMFAHLRMIVAFKGEYKETYATLVGFRGRGLGTPDNPIRYTAILEYYNEYSEKTIKKEFLNSGILHPSEGITSNEIARRAKMGEKIKIQYTKNSERVVEERYGFKNKYKLMHYLTPIIITGTIQIIGFILLMFGIIFEN